MRTEADGHGVAHETETDQAIDEGQSAPSTQMDPSRGAPERSSILCEHLLQCVLSKSAVLSGSLKSDAVFR